MKPDKYEQQALNFLTETNTEFKAEFIEHGYHFEGDKKTRDIYKITLRRGSREYCFNFGQSLNDSEFYYTMGRQKINIDRKYLQLEKKRLLVLIRRQSPSFLNNNKSDIIHYPKAPTAYDVLTCLTKYDPGTFVDFCNEFGYDTDSRRAERTYKAVREEYLNICALYNDAELKKMSEIQ